MKKPTRYQPLAVSLTVVGAALAVCSNSAQAQVTFEQLTNDLVAYYPLDEVNPDGVTTPDYVSGRDLVLYRMSVSDLVASDRSVGAVSNCFNLTQSGGATVLYYNSTGQDPLTGGGDFLPFANQLNGTMSFWLKGNSVANDVRFFGECDTTGGQGNPLWLWGDHGTGPGSAHLLFRQEQGTGPGGSIPMSDGTYELPVPGYYQTQTANYTTNKVLDGTWHLFTVTISNAYVDVYVDGVRDPGAVAAGGDYTNGFGEATVCRPMLITNTYYTTNLYPFSDPPASNPPPNGYVRWMFNGLFGSGSTCFGGFKRGGPSAGVPCQIDDIGFWDRPLSAEEITFVMTNGLAGLNQNTNIIRVNYFSADFGEVGEGDTARLSWSVSGTHGAPGSIVISGLGDVTALGDVGETNVTLAAGGIYNFTLTAHNGIDTDKEATVTVKTFPSVDSNWQLVQRFDGLYNDTTQGIGNDIYGEPRWISRISSFAGSFDRWNVITFTNGGGANKVLTPRTGYTPDVTSAVGFESEGALAYGELAGSTITVGETNTLFFRFSIKDPQSFAATYSAWSGMDFGAGLSEYNFWEGPLGAGGNGIGCSMHILRSDPSGLYQAVPFDLTANNYDGNGVVSNFSYITSVDAAGLSTNANYYVWMDVEQYNTMDGGATNTVNPPRFTLHLQEQGDVGRTTLFSGFGGDRNFGAEPTLGPNVPTPILDKVYFNICNQSIVAAEPGAYFETNMIAIDDVYLSKDGVESSVPRILELTSIVRSPGSATISWSSLGSMHFLETYSVRRKLLITDPWTTIASGVASGGGSTSYTDNTLGSSDQAYYQISWP